MLLLNTRKKLLFEYITIIGLLNSQMKKLVREFFSSARSVSILFIGRVQNQRFGHRRSRFDDTLKGSGVPIEVRVDVKLVLQPVMCDYPYDKKPLVNSGLSLMGLPWSSSPGVMS